MPASLAISGNHAPEHTMDSRRMTPSSSPQKKSNVNKQSWDYILRSGLAGGIAGCAVRHFHPPICCQLLTHCTGKDCSRSARSRQDPLPGFKSPICKVHRLMVWLLPSHARHSNQRGHARSLSWPFSNFAPYLSLRWYQVPRL